MTNGDKIRSMTDEELVEMMFVGAGIAGAGNFKAPPGRNCIGGCKSDSCRDCWLDYLKQEAEDEKAGVQPRCVYCVHLQDEVIDEFPVSKCPFGGTILQPWAHRCDQYARRTTE